MDQNKPKIFFIRQLPDGKWEAEILHCDDQETLGYGDDPQKALENGMAQWSPRPLVNIVTLAIIVIIFVVFIAIILLKWI